MSVQASAWVIENSKHKGSALLLLLMIANHAHADGTNSFPSIEILAKECRLSSRQISRLVAILEQSGELSLERSKGRKGHGYAIKMEANPDILAEFNPDILARLNSPTLTNRAPNPDKSGNPPTPPYKDNHIRKEIRERERAREPENPFVSVYYEFYPGTHLDLHRQSLIIVRVSQEGYWRSALEFWKGNGYRAQSVEKICNYYDELKTGNNGNGKSNHGSRKLTTQEFIDNTKEFYDNYVP